MGNVTCTTSTRTAVPETVEHRRRRLKKQRKSRRLHQRRGLGDLQLEPVPRDDIEEALTADLETHAEFDGEGPANLRLGCVKIRLIGRGGGGFVYLGLYVPSLTLVAIK